MLADKGYDSKKNIEILKKSISVEDIKEIEIKKYTKNFIIYHPLLFYLLHVINYTYIYMYLSIIIIFLIMFPEIFIYLINNLVILFRCSIMYFRIKL